MLNFTTNPAQVRIKKKCGLNILLVEIHLKFEIEKRKYNLTVYSNNNFIQQFLIFKQKKK